MSRTPASTVAEYIAAQPPASRRVLRSVRTALRRALPGADEAISYGIPAYRLDGRIVIYFAGWQSHYSLYPVNRTLLARIAKVKAPYTVNEKGTIRFPLDRPVPTAFIQAIAKLRAQDAAAARARARAARARR